MAEVTDDGIREWHGMKCLRSSEDFIIVEHENEIEVPSYPGSRSLTIFQARYLARKLYRLARRIEKRQEASGE